MEGRTMEGCGGGLIPSWVGHARPLNKLFVNKPHCPFIRPFMGRPTGRETLKQGRHEKEKF